MTGVFDDSIDTRMKCCVYCCVVLLFLLTVRAAKKESCERCVPADICPFYTNMKNEDQTNWQNRFKCEGASSSKPVYGFSSSAKGDLVCCPENIWQVDDTSHLQQNGESPIGSPSTQQAVKMEKNSFNYHPNYNAPNYFGYPSSSPSNQLQGYPNGAYDGYGNPGNAGSGITGNQYGNTNGNQRSDKGYQVYENDNENGGANGDQFGSQANDNKNSASPGKQGNQNEEGYDNDSQRSPWSGRRRGERPNNVQNPYFQPANRNDNSFGGTKPATVGGQCPVTSFPPDPNTGCCGQEATNPDSINASPNNAHANPRYTDTQSSWQPHAYGYRPSWLPFSDKVKREADVNITFDNRIAGGKETELEQFPWTVLLTTVFQYPDKDAAFSCGGSLISSRYVLTAGHCVYDKQGPIKDIEINLAEYDKRTFPKDCKNVLGRGEVCVENIVMHADKVHLHPEYDDNMLHNDIALIRLRGDAPYTDYIRPICLPPINVDSPQLSNLRLAVAGWGRNGQYKSDIKQSTVVNLVPYSDCMNSYPYLTRLQLCAAGYTGEDTCKGDSGGPLMMMYGGKYFVSGVVSGKRSDVPCGTSVPSLYTNVYAFLPWIRRVITN